MIGCIGAMESEIHLLREWMEEKRTETISGVEYHTGKINGVPCVLASCGVGKVNAAICAQTMILRYAPAAVIGFGVAGGIGEGVEIGDTVVASAFVQHDMDLSPLGEKKGFVQGPDTVTFPSDAHLSEAMKKIAASAFKTTVHYGVIATGDQFIADAETLRQIKKEFGAIACEMEGGSIAQVCAANRVPFSMLRVISDNADSNAKLDFPTFLIQAAGKSATLVRELLPEVEKLL